MKSLRFVFDVFVVPSGQPFRYSVRIVASVIFTIFFAAVGALRLQGMILSGMHLLQQNEYVITILNYHNVYSDMIQSAFDLIQRCSTWAMLSAIIIVIAYQFLLLNTFKHDVEFALKHPDDHIVKDVFMPANISKSPLFVMYVEFCVRLLTPLISYHQRA